MHDDGSALPSRPDVEPLVPRRSRLDRLTHPRDLRSLDRAALAEIARDLRQALLDTVSRTGGHLGGSLGVVELTVALHACFETPADKLIWDVSHQCYPHKILTGRRTDMTMLRQRGGPSGFTSRKESDFDPFGAAHSSTSISAALGIATARDLAGRTFDVLPVIGDGALSGGMAYEALNNLGSSGTRVIVVLNDNNMSISQPSGALPGHLATLRGAMPSREQRARALATGTLPAFPAAPTLFDQLGVRYAGPFDGHDLDELLTVFQLARSTATGPLLIHIVTDKGHGYAPAEAASDRYHAVGRFDVQAGVQVASPPGPPSYTCVFSDALIDEARRDDRIVAVTAAMPSGTGIDRFAKAFPSRAFDVGIAEQHAVTFCAGLACEGMKPFAAIYSTFLQRGYDQVVHDVAIQRLPVRFAIDRAGLVGADGVTHQGTYDVSYLGCLPGFVLMAAGDEADLVHMVATAAAIDDRPSALRFPRGEGIGIALPEVGEPLEIGRGRIMRRGDRLAFLCYGARLSAAMQAAELLDRLDIPVTVADARFAKPIDDQLVARLLRDHPVVMTVEEGAIGGFAAQVFDSVARQGLERLLPRLRTAMLPDQFIEHDSPAGQMASVRLDAHGLMRRALRALSKQRTPDLPRGHLSVVRPY